MPNRPIGEWTLQEVQRYCKESTDCNNCEFLKARVCYTKEPTHWDLPIRYSDKTIKFAKSVATILPGLGIYIFKFDHKDKCLSVFLTGTMGKDRLVAKYFSLSTDMVRELDGEYIHEILSEDDSEC